MRKIKFDELNAPLYKAVKKYAQKEPMRFHMPSHKGVGCDLFKSAKFDITELEFSDNLLNPVGVIRESEKLLAKAYGTDECLMFTNGATSGIFAMLYAVSRITKKIILSRNSHKSIYNALSVMGITPYFCEVEYNEYGFPQPLSVDKLKKAIKEYPDAGAVLVTSPDYFGQVSDLAEIKKVCGDKILIADAAHGGHFAYTETLRNRAELFADVTVLGVHKTLNCYTGSCIVLCKNAFYRTLCDGRALFHSTSPQYLSMCSIDYSRALMEKVGKKLYNELTDALFKLGIKRIETYDFSKLILEGGSELYEYLIKNNVYPECVYGNYVLLILSPFDKPMLKKLRKLLKKFTWCKVGDNENVIEAPASENAFEFSDCFSKEMECVALSDAVGRVLASEIGLYPPGVPVYVRGQTLSQDCINFLLKYEKSLFGVDSGRVYVLK